MGNDPNRQFKTLVTEGKTGEHYVFVIPVSNELDLKKAARAVNEKNIAMVKEKELFPLTGYVHGGCSPLGMKKIYPTVFHLTAESASSIVFSAGKVGASIEVNPFDLKKLINLHFEDIIKAD